MGAVAATAGPAIASLTGDYFPSRERGRIYAYILAGEAAGTAVGFSISSTVASAISWRASFVLLAIPGFFLARELWRTVPEPRRGGQSRLQPGVVDLHAAVAAGGDEVSGQAGEDPEPTEDLAAEAARKRGVEPDPRLVLRVDPRRLHIVDAVRYIVAIPTNALLIISSALGYFFFSGLLTFLVVFVRGHYNVNQATTTLALLLLVIASVIGTLVSGRLTDLMVRNGYLESRVLVPAFCYLGATVLFVPGLLSSHHLTPALWFDMGGAALLSAANPPLDAARLDIMPAGLWGRAESTRTLVRSFAQALAPLVFGLLADAIAGILPQQAPIGTHVQPSPGSTTGLQFSFLIMLVTLGGAGWFMLRARHTYARDVATAAASQASLARLNSADGDAEGGDTAPA
jgi:predicted MFS family arabinose efflux permease